MPLDLSTAHGLATAVRDNVLGPFCSRIQIAGSVRREKPKVKDIEICAISCIGNRVVESDSLFGKQTDTISFPLLDAFLQSEINNERGNLIWWQQKENGVRVGDGDRHKKLRINPDVLPVDPETGEKVVVNLDLFIVTPDTWGNQFAIRTGHSHFSEAMMWLVKRAGCEHKEGALWRNGEPFACREEVEFFDLLGVPYLDPRERTLAAAERLVPGFVPREFRDAA